MIKVYTKKDLDVQLKKNKKVLALFYSSWCPYCIRFVPTFEKKVAKMDFESVVHVLLDDYDSPLWDEYDVPAVPTIIFFENGNVCKRLDGRLGMGLSEGEFRVWIEEFKSS
jgi:thiol-disulfide isomerase/thioredoxin